MNGVLTIVALAGHVALLLWGMRMVQAGVERAFGSDLRRILGRALRRRLIALAAGTVVTMLLQSGATTSMMVTTFAARGAVDLLPAMAVMLGANVGTALIVKALSFNVAVLSPVLLVGGYVALEHGRRGRYQELGRVGIGLGLMLLALHLMLATLAPDGGVPEPGRLVVELEHDPLIRRLVASATADPFIDVAIGTIVTVAAHSSIAVLLVLVSLASSHILTPLAAISLALGANLGAAVPPLLEAGGANPANRRVPAANLLFRVVGCAALLPFLRPLAAEFWHLAPEPRAALTSFHLAFNLLLACVFVCVLGPVRTLLLRLFPDRSRSGSDEMQPQFLDEAALATPYLALSNVSREVLRMGDLIDGLLRLVPETLGARAGRLSERAERLRGDLDTLHEAVKLYLGRLDRTVLTPRDAMRLSDLTEFAVNLGHAADILEHMIVQAAARRDETTAEADRLALMAVHARSIADLRLALSTMMTEDGRVARELLDGKRATNEAERVAVRDHLARIGGGEPEALGASTLFLTLMRDLKRVNSHLASIGYAVLEAQSTDAAPVEL